MYENNPATDPIKAPGHDYDPLINSLIDRNSGEVKEPQVIVGPYISVSAPF